MDEANTAAPPHSEKDLVTFVSIVFLSFYPPGTRTPSLPPEALRKPMIGFARYSAGTAVSNDLLRRRDSQTSIENGYHALEVLLY